MLATTEPWVSWVVVPTAGVLTGTLIAGWRRHESRGQLAVNLEYALAGCAVAIVVWAVLMWAAAGTRTA